MKFSKRNIFMFFVLVLLLFIFLSFSVFTAEVKKVIVDSDLNFLTDDNMAILMMLQSDDVEVLGITAVTLGSLGEQGIANTLRTLEAAGKSDIGVYPGSINPLMGKINIPEPKAPTPPPGGFAKAQPKSTHAVDFIVDTINANPGEVSLLVIGPSTNIALALRKDPTITPKIKEIYWMGGQFGISNGRVQPWGAGEVATLVEYNIRADAEAAHIVLHSGIPITIAPLELGRWVKIRQEHLDKIIEAGTPVAELFKYPGRFFDSKIKPDDPQSGWDWTYDELAALAVIKPELLNYKEVPVDVVLTSGPTYGQTIVYSSRNAPEDAPVVKLLYDVDYDAFMEFFISLMTK